MLTSFIIKLGKYCVGSAKFFGRSKFKPLNMAERQCSVDSAEIEFTINS